MITNRLSPGAIIGIVLAGIVALVLGIAVMNALVRGVTAAQSMEVDGSFKITGASCEMKDNMGYNDIQTGTLVKITDETGKQIGAASLGQCIDPPGGGAEFDFSTTVPQADSYGFTVADRGTVQYSHDDVQNNNIELTLS